MALTAPHSSAHLMRYDAGRKSVGVAYLLWFFLGVFGAHRIYLGEKKTGLMMLLISAASLPLMFVYVGFITIGITAFLAIVDLFLIPGMARAYNDEQAGAHAAPAELTLA